MAEAETAGIRVAAVLGTARPGNYTSKALALVVDEFRKHEDVALDLIDPGRINLPLPGADPGSPETERLKQTVSRATGLVFATPECHGSFSSVAKLIIENLGFPSVLATKPVALLGVAAGQIGAIKSLEQLRSVDTGDLDSVEQPAFGDDDGVAISYLPHLGLRHLAGGSGKG